MLRHWLLHFVLQKSSLEEKSKFFRFLTISCFIFILHPVAASSCSRRTASWVSSGICLSSWLWWSGLKMGKIKCCSYYRKKWRPFTMTMKSLSYLDTYGTGGGTPGPSSSQLIIWLYIRMTVFAFESNLQRVPSDVAICTGVTSTFLMHFLFSRFILYFTRLLLMASFNQVKRGLQVEFSTWIRELR